MESVFLILLTIYISAIVLGFILKRVRIPWVFSALFVGTILSMLSFVKVSKPIELLAEIGMYFLLFIVGYELEFEKILKNKHILFSHTDELWKYNNKIIKQNKHQQKPKGFCFNDNLQLCKIGASTVMIHNYI